MSSDTTLDCMFDAKPGCTCSHCQANRRIEALEGEVKMLKRERNEAENKYAVAIDDRMRLRVALEEIASGRYSGLILPSYPPQDPAVVRARKALEDDKQ
jgi:hypothetical protein